ncbi:MAG: STAS domain-containing protein [Tateyamaria sp.]
MADPIALPRRVDSASVPVLAAQLREASAQDSINVDARETMYLGALGAQVLVSAARTMQAKGGTLSITGLTDRAASQLAIMGVEELTNSEGVS